MLPASLAECPWLLAALIQHWTGLRDEGAEARVDHKPDFRLLVQCSGCAGNIVSGGWGVWPTDHSPGFSFFICTMERIIEDFMLRTVPGPL